MVYCGKPSKDCQKCRERRIKCDLLRPGCKQCIRVQHQCPGYRQELDAKFRNQTADVIRKASRQIPSRPKKALVWRMKRQPTSHASLASRSEEPRTQAPRDISLDEVQSQQILELAIPCSIVQRIEAHATCFFLSSYVLGSHFEYLPSLYSQLSMNEQLCAGIYAVSLAIFSNEFNSSEILEKARQWHTHALHSTNIALSSAHGATKDSTLVAVMLLSLYETITCRTRLPLTPWTDHISGATELVRLRGRQQLRTPLGFQLFKQMTDNIIVDCVQREVAVPSDIVALRAYAVNFVDGSGPAWPFSDIIVRYTSFRATIKDGTLSDSDAIIACAMKIDGDLISWSKTLPLQWRYETVLTHTDQELVYEGYYHLYHDHRIAQMLNAFRMTRILIHQLINDRVVKRIYSSRPSLISPDYNALAQLSADTIKNLTSEICATVPQFTTCPPSFPSQASKLQVSPPPVPTPLPVISPQTRATSQPKPQAPNLAQNADSFRIAGGYFLLGPLFLVGSLPLSHDSLRLWVINRLNFVGDSMKIPQAIVLAKILEGKENVDNGLHMCHAF